MEIRQISNWDKFCLLMWKNSLLQWRNKVQTIFEIIVPIMFCFVIFATRSLISPVEMKNATYFKPIDQSLTEETLSRPFENSAIGYTPQNEHLDDLTHGVTWYLNYHNFTYKAAANKRELETLIEDNSIIAGIVYHHPENITECPQNLKYSLLFPSEWEYSPQFFYNWQANSLFRIYSSGDPGKENRNDTGFPLFFQEAFASIQSAMAHYFFIVHCYKTVDDCQWAGDTEFPHVTVQRFPSPPHTIDNTLEILQIFVSFCIILSLTYSTMNTVRFIVMEKERQLKYAIQMMGVPGWIQWISWFVRTMILMIIIISFMVGLLKMSVFVHSDLTTIWAFLFIYSISMTTYCFMLSVFFSKANSAAAAAVLMWIISYFPLPLIYRKNSEEMSLMSKIIAALCSNTEMGYGVQLILRLEENGEGLQWSNFLKPVTNDDDISIGITMAFMLITSCIYLLIALFVDQLYSRYSGKWYFPFTKQFWCSENENDKNDNNFEADSENRPVVRIVNLRKDFGGDKALSRGLSLNLFEDEITVLLGNGKTTIISMLTGMLPPTSGKAIINGYNIQNKHHQKVTDCIGFCPQHNMLYDELTLREHITFYSRLKGMSRKGGMEEVKKYVTLLKLEPQTNALCLNLSRGLQRKLMLGLALCAQSKIVFLDEPSSGLDPVDRHVLWDVLQSEKKGRTILLTTNFMKEADMLGDKIVIVKDGEVDDLETLSLSKNRLNVGFNLICYKKADCNSKWVTFTLRSFISRIKLKSEIGSQLIYELPNGQAYRFEKLLKYLETDGSRLNLVSFGIWSSEDTTFSSTDLRKQRTMSSTPRTQNNEIFKDHHELLPLRGLRLELYQWRAMLKKKYIFWCRSWTLFILQFLISVAFIVMSIVIFHIVGIDEQLEPVHVSLELYKKSVTMLQNSNLSVPYVFNYTGIMSGYREIIQERHTAHIVDAFDEDIQTRFLRLAKTLLVRFNSQYLVGMSPGDNDTVIAWFNNEPFNTVPLTINLIHNAIVRSKYGSNYSVSVTQEPLPYTIKSRINNLLAGNNLGFQLATLISFAMAFISALYAIYYIKERVSRIKQLQFIGGVRVSTFWLTSFLFDYLMYLSTVVVMISTILIFQEDDWSTFDELLPALVILVVFGFAILPITYVLSWCFSIVSTAIFGLTIIYLITGAILFFVDAMLSLPFFVGVMGPFKDYLVIFPHYSLSTSLNNLNLMNMVKRLCQIKCSRISVDVCDQERLCSLDENCCGRNYYAWNVPGIGRSLTYMSANGLIFFIVLLLVECRCFKRLFQLVAYYYYSRIIFSKQNLGPQSEEDSDVDEEKRKVNAMSIDDLKVNNLVLQNVSKFYCKVIAVDQVSIGINESECFGLFGVGKTTMIEMLTGSTDISNGEAFVRGISLKTDTSNVRKIIGYCPQSDALFEELTGREHLEIFALLRGVRTKDIKNSINCLANDLSFMQQIDQKVFEYSIGNKRKLSIAVAFIGNPDILCLHEPTKGMDQDSRQKLFHMIREACNYGKTIVLASNNLEDHTFCSRITIMVKGKLGCLGTTEHLKNKFSEGFLFTVKVSSQSQDVKDYIKSKFPTAKLKKDHENLLTYHVPSGRESKGSTNFALMQHMKKSHLIEDYSIYQPSLDQVFSSFI